jgi:prophage regulatory protein
MTNSSERGPYTPEPTANGAVPLAAEPTPKRSRRRLSPLVVDAKRLAKLLCAGVRTVRTWDAAGKLPAPIRIGGRVVWRVDEITAWLGAGAPNRETWAARKAASRK